MSTRCPNCGAAITQNQANCEYCGVSLSNKKNNNFERALTKASESSNITNDSSTIDSSSFAYKSSVLTVILLIITCGIYHYFLLADWITVINKNIDRQKHIDPALAIFLSIITCSVSDVYFMYKVAKNAESVTKRSGGNTNLIRKGLSAPPSNLPEIVLWGYIISLVIFLVSGFTLGIIYAIFIIWKSVAIQKSVEYMAGVTQSDN